MKDIHASVLRLRFPAVVGTITQKLPIPFLNGASSAKRTETNSPEEQEPPIDFSVALKSAVVKEAPGADSKQEAEEDGRPDPNDETYIKEELEKAREEISSFRPQGERSSRRPLIEAKNVTARFGGLTAVDSASMTVREGEIVGLIGPNGAGKTTLFNAIAGYNTPAEGEIYLYGKNVTSFPVYKRAKVGVARTFQIIQLFNQLTVYQNLLVATHVHNQTGFFSHLVASDRSIEAEKQARASQVLELLDLKDVAERRAGDLPFGVLRMVEVARSLVTGYRLIMLDEPASGLDNQETDRLMEVLRFVRGVGVTLLLIEHDVRMVTGVSDYMYVLDQGQMIAEGPPEQIQKDDKVIAAYLGEPEKEEVA